MQKASQNLKPAETLISTIQNSHAMLIETNNVSSEFMLDKNDSLTALEKKSHKKQNNFKITSNLMHVKIQTKPDKTVQRSKYFLKNQTSKKPLA
jgi:hypothetical protein